MSNAWCGLTSKDEPPPTRGSRKTKAAGDGGWLRGLVRRLGFKLPVRQDWGMKYHRLSTEERYEIPPPLPPRKYLHWIFPCVRQACFPCSFNFVRMLSCRFNSASRRQTNLNLCGHHKSILFQSGEILPKRHQ